MRLIIAGSRNFDDEETFRKVMALVDRLIDSAYLDFPSEVVSGTCRGADTMGERWAKDHGHPIKRFPADWKQYGKAAGPIRNKEMAEYGDALILLWKPSSSSGSLSMFNEAIKKNLPIVSYNLATGTIALKNFKL